MQYNIQETGVWKHMYAALELFLNKEIHERGNKLNTQHHQSEKSNEYNLKANTIIS